MNEGFAIQFARGMVFTILILPIRNDKGIMGFVLLGIFTYLITK